MGVSEYESEVGFSTFSKMKKMVPAKNKMAAIILFTNFGPIYIFF